MQAQIGELPREGPIVWDSAVRLRNSSRRGGPTFSISKVSFLPCGFLFKALTMADIYLSPTTSRFDTLYAYARYGSQNQARPCTAHSQNMAGATSHCKGGYCIRILNTSSSQIVPKIVLCTYIHVYCVAHIYINTHSIYVVKGKLQLFLANFRCNSIHNPCRSRVHKLET